MALHGKLAEISSGTQLGSLSLAVIDTETTGLDVATARVIEVGGVRIERGKLLEDGGFSRLIDPGEPIPAASRAIHGIGDDDVAGESGFAEVAGELARWMGGAVMLGYATGFDLTVLGREHERAGLRWQPPRALDVRDLVKLLDPALPDHSIETLASWLGVELRDRHRALGDARLAAKIYLALVPRLQARGITTLAEAEAACRAAAPRLGVAAGSSWQEVVRLPEAGRGSAGVAGIDSYPYRRRVAEVMSDPVFVAADARVRDVLREIIERRISSVFVRPREGEAGPGIITERDLLQAIDAAPDEALAKSAGDLAQRPLDSVAESDFVYRAIGRMNRKRFRHLGVVDQAGELVGALSARRLLRQRAEAAMWLGDALDVAASPGELGAVWGDLTLVARGLLADHVDARDIAAVISHELCALTARACELAEAELVDGGHGPAPVDYAMLVLGSGGRGESLLAMDQDNAIVYESGAPGGPEDQWLERLGARVADILNMAGVAYCKGGVMARNSQWRMSVEGWRAAVEGWLRRSQPTDLMSTDIFFDAVPVHGTLDLGEALRAEALEAAGRSRAFLKLMAVNAAAVDVPLGWLGRFKLEDRRMDLKRGGLMPIFSAARVLALQHGVTARATPERLAAVRGKGDAEPALVDRLTDAHGILLGAILEQQLHDLEAGIKLSNRVAPNELSAAERDRLRWALEQVGLVANVLGDPLAFG
ncbi:MAG TPA: putative nucleotidyltransferase substrate binding domain-containing protein [Aestuariivirgaceae bacterium]|nr:putative nucleotidyltransferase substrate binding domain-containing protein [Aestuariivirgaceae bacterium]